MTPRDSFRHRVLGGMLAILLLAAPALAQPADDAAPPKANPADVESVDAIITALYDVISGPAGPRDWDRFRSLMLPEAQLVPTFRNRETGQAGYRAMSVDDYATSAAEWFSQQGFFEIETARTTEQYGNLVHAFSTYESRRTADPEEKPFMRGINSIQLLKVGGRWWVANIAWQPEYPDLPIPEKYQKKSGMGGNAYSN